LSTEPSTVAVSPSTTTTTIAAASPATGEPYRCHTSQLAATDDGAAGDGNGNQVGEIVFRNISDQVCTMSGYPGLRRLDESRNPLPTDAAWDLAGPRAALVFLAPHQQAAARYSYPTGGCQTTTGAAPAGFAEVTPPDERDFIVVHSNMAPCDPPGTIHIAAVQAGKQAVPGGAPAPVLVTGTYTGWTWPTPPVAGWRSLTLSLDVTIDPGAASPFFYAHQVSFVGGVGGYVGLQNGTHGKIALFSLFGGCDQNTPTAGCPASAATAPAGSAFGVPGPGAACRPMTLSTGQAPEGPGQSCLLPMAWAENRGYRLTIASTAPGLWQASVVDSSNGQRSSIGTIRVPSSWGGLGSDSVSWIEYYGPQLTACAAEPRTQVKWGDGQAADPPAAPVSPISTHNYLSTSAGPRCANAQVTDDATPSPGSVQSAGG